MKNKKIIGWGLLYLFLSILMVLWCLDIIPWRNGVPEGFKIEYSECLNRYRVCEEGHFCRDTFRFEVEAKNYAWKEYEERKAIKCRQDDKYWRDVK